MTFQNLPKVGFFLKNKPSGSPARKWQQNHRFRQMTVYRPEENTKAILKQFS
jgi:hypothetical protein